MSDYSTTEYHSPNVMKNNKALYEVGKSDKVYRKVKVIYRVSDKLNIN